MRPRPAVAPPEPWSFPEPAAHTLSNGTRLLTYHLPGQHVLAARHVLPFALREEPRDREGVALIAAYTVDEGTESMDSEVFADELGRVGAECGGWVSDTAFGVDIDVVGGQLEPALALARECVVHPAFRADEVARQVRSRLADIELERVNPSTQVMRHVASACFEPDDRRSRPRGGTADTVAPVTADDVRTVYEKHLTPEGATLVIAGDLTDVDVRGIAERTFGRWTGSGTVAAPAAPARWRPRTAQVIVVDRPGATQSELCFACPGPTIVSEPSWAPFPLLSVILGGGPTARIDAVLREERGLTYGMRTSFVSRPTGGIFFARGAVRTDATGESLRLLAPLLGAGGKVGAEELGETAVYLGQTAPTWFAQAGAVAHEAVGALSYGVTTRETTRYLGELSSVTSAEAAQAWERWCGGPWTVVISGDAERIVDDVRAAGLGPVEVVNS